MIAPPIWHEVVLFHPGDAAPPWIVKVTPRPGFKHHVEPVAFGCTVAVEVNWAPWINGGRPYIVHMMDDGPCTPWIGPMDGRKDLRLEGVTVDFSNGAWTHAYWDRERIWAMKRPGE